MNKVVFVIALIAAAVLAEQIAVSTSMIREINQKQTTWKAAHNRITRMPESQARRLLGIKKLQSYTWRVKEYSAEERLNAPDEFDSRTNWPNCDTMKDIRDQKQCGSCWAFGAAEAMSDRQCIFKGENVRLSPEDILSCGTSGYTSCGDCAYGGQPGCAWVYWCQTGVVSDDCYPYLAENSSTPECANRCVGNTALDWNSDKRKGSKTYSVVGESDMMTELSTNGPFEVAFMVYADFFSYSSGVYQHVSGGYEGNHAVKVIGYGVDNGVKYWTCANSWNTDWGDEGYFRIRRGNNECSIESQAWAGIPL
jgi:cathepsin B